MPINDHVHKQIVKHLDEVSDWFREHSDGLNVPIYSSYDMRDAGFKVSVVDANIYPAGFNNICQADKESAPELLDEYIRTRYGNSCKNILLLTEEHTNNAFYWENVSAIAKIVEETDRKVRFAIPAKLDGPLKVQSIGGTEMEVFSAARKGDQIGLDGFDPDLIISNNDFTESYGEWGEGLTTPMNPPRQLGWYQRKKSRFFRHFNELVLNFAELIEIDPWLLQVETHCYAGFDLSDESKKEQLAGKVDQIISGISEKYREHDVKDEPFLMMKNNSGTYGLAVVQVRSADDVLNFNYKSRKKMKAAKGGKDVDEVILQEGIASVVSAEGEVAEPAIYLLGCQLVGGFLRAHGKKGPRESLNSPGAVYKRLCVSDLRVSVEGHPLENVYGWLARIGALAVGRESAEMKVEYLGFDRA